MFLNYCLSPFIKVIASLRELQGLLQPTTGLLHRTVCRSTGWGAKGHGSGSKPKAESLKHTQAHTGNSEGPLLEQAWVLQGSTCGPVPVSEEAGSSRETLAEAGLLAYCWLPRALRAKCLLGLPGSRKRPWARDSAKGKAGGP